MIFETEVNEKIINLDSTEKYFLVTGIASSKLLTEKLNQLNINFTHFSFKDHHYFKKSEIDNLITIAKKRNINNLIVTEKDYYRLGKDNLNLIESYFNLFYSQIEFDFIKEEKLLFNKQITKFI